MEYDRESSSDEISQRQRIFAFHRRFAPSLSRFLYRTLGIESDVSLNSVGRASPSFASSADLILFCASKNDPAAALLISRTFLLGVIDRYLGNDTFAPGKDSDTWSELDGELSIPFISRLFEILLGFCVPSVSFPLDPVSVPFQGVLPEGEWFTVIWSVTWNSEIFPLFFLLPAEVAFGEETFPQAKSDTSKTDEELQRYIEMRRATSDKIRDVEPISPTSPFSDETAKIRVLVGSFDLRRDDFSEMEPGDILATDISAAAHFTLFVNGNSVCHVQPGEENGEKAVIIEDVL